MPDRPYAARIHLKVSTNYQELGETTKSTDNRSGRSQLGVLSIAFIDVLKELPDEVITDWLQAREECHETMKSKSTGGFEDSISIMLGITLGHPSNCVEPSGLGHTCTITREQLKQDQRAIQMSHLIMPASDSDDSPSMPVSNKGWNELFLR